MVFITLSDTASLPVVVYVHSPPFLSMLDFLGLLLLMLLRLWGHSLA